MLYVLIGDVVKGEGDTEETADPAKVAGYLMYSWTSLAASITKLAGISWVFHVPFQSCIHFFTYILDRVFQWAQLRNLIRDSGEQPW